VYTRKREKARSSSPPQPLSTSTIGPVLKQPSETDLDEAMKQANMDLHTLNLILELYYEHKGNVATIKSTLMDAHDVRLSRSRISKVLDLLNLPRLKRNRFF
jgi:hypothetical protein